MAAKQRKAVKPSTPKKVGQGLWEENVPDTGTLVPNSGTDDRIEAIDRLDDEQRTMLAKLLSERMSLADLADNLVELAKMRTDKTAAVGLRAIQEINAIRGIHDSKAQEAPPMFQLPEGTSVNVRVEKVVK